MSGLGEAAEWLRRILGIDGARREKDGAGGGSRGSIRLESPESRAPYDTPSTRWRGGPQ